MSEAYKQGRKDARDGQYVNPYTFGTEQANDWEYGYLAELDENF